MGAPWFLAIETCRWCQYGAISLLRFLRGDLTTRWREAHLKELLADMD